MGTVNFPLQLAPTTLNQSILPNWGFSIFSINLGTSSDPKLETDILDAVGSYGKQLGHIAEAVELVVKHLKLLDAGALRKVCTT